MEALPLFLPSTTSPRRPVNAGCVPNIASGSFTTRSTPIPDSRVKFRSPRIGLLSAISNWLVRVPRSARPCSLGKSVMRWVALEHVQRDDQLFQRGVAGSFAQAVRAAMHYFSPSFDTRQLRG